MSRSCWTRRNRSRSPRPRRASCLCGCRRIRQGCRREHIAWNFMCRPPTIRVLRPMKHRSSFRDKGGTMRLSHRHPHPWYREPWPWLLAAGPLIVVVASLWSAWIAVKTNDGVVAEDYYKRGLAINQELKHVAANAQLRLGATVRVAANGEIRVRMEGMSDLITQAPA